MTSEETIAPLRIPTFGRRELIWALVVASVAFAIVGYKIFGLGFSMASIE